LRGLCQSSIFLSVSALLPTSVYPRSPPSSLRHSDNGCNHRPYAGPMISFLLAVLLVINVGFDFFFSPDFSSAPLRFSFLTNFESDSSTPEVVCRFVFLCFVDPLPMSLSLSPYGAPRSVEVLRPFMDSPRTLTDLSFPRLYSRFFIILLFPPCVFPAARNFFLLSAYSDPSLCGAGSPLNLLGLVLLAVLFRPLGFTDAIDMLMNGRPHVLFFFFFSCGMVLTIFVFFHVSFFFASFCFRLTFSAKDGITIFFSPRSALFSPLLLWYAWGWASVLFSLVSAFWSSIPDQALSFVFSFFNYSVLEVSFCQVLLFFLWFFLIGSFSFFSFQAALLFVPGDRFRPGFPSLVFSPLPFFPGGGASNYSLAISAHIRFSSRVPHFPSV